jgi:phenylalanyl-tRNA synthetase beta chain
MKVSYEWLSTLVDLHDISIHQVADALNRAGIEVESIVSLSQGNHITTGLVLTQERLEGTHLSKVVIDTGKHGTRTIICGAPNIKANQKVIVALPGAQLKDITIQKTTIKGIESNGMVCSLSELGIPHKFLNTSQLEGIEVLQDSFPIGEDDVLSILGFSDQYLELKLLANRPDLLAMNNVAIEVSALLNRPLLAQKEVPLPVVYSKDVYGAAIHTAKAAHFSTVVIKGINSTITPTWMKARLMASGIRPIHFLVDLGNYLMMLTGQPVHMYDLAKLPGSSFVITDTYEGDFVALDGQTYGIKRGDISILSDGQIMCLAGVMGAQACAVDESTTSVVLEVASFDGASVRKVANRLNLLSDASTRFAKGVNQSSFEIVIHTLIKTLIQLTTVLHISNIVTTGSVKQITKQIPLNVDKINAILGTTFTDTFVKETLTRLHFSIKNNLVSIPLHRVDVSADADLAEEVIRLVGFDSIQMTPLSQTIEQAGLTLKQENLRKIKRYFIQHGLTETLSYSLISKNQVEPFSFLPISESYVIQNPLTEDHHVVRSSLLYSTLLTAKYNFERQTGDGQYFEVSQVYGHHHNRLELAVVLTGQSYRQGLMAPQPVDFFTIKGLVEGLLKILKIDTTRYFWKVEPIEATYLHPYRYANLFIGQEKIGVIGELSPQGKDVINAGKLNVVVLQLNLTALLDVKTSATKMTTVSKFPIVNRDLACLVDQSVTYQALIQSVKKAGKPFVTDVQVFDIYKGTNVKECMMSVALRMSLNDLQRTLTDDDIQKAMLAIKNQLISEFKAEFRS